MNEKPLLSAKDYEQNQKLIGNCQDKEEFINQQEIR
jgi:hypothetical protein